jgi:hypothetical protein
MFSRILRDFKILRNHKHRVNSVVIRSNEDIVRAMDFAKSQYLEFERKEDKENTLKWKSTFEVFEWLIDATK